MSSLWSSSPKIVATDFGLEVGAKLRGMQNDLCDALAGEDGMSFQEEQWERPEGGGGISRVLENGNLFEKAGVMFSEINGSKLPEVVRQEIQPREVSQQYFATGVSLILHPFNPHVPSVHFNVRYFEIGETYWFGGGMDLTPYYPVREDCIHFHRTIKAACDRFDRKYYPRFKENCDSYFFLPHRGEPRGIGGIFFDALKGDQPEILAFILALGEAMLEGYLPIARKRRGVSFGEKEREFLHYRRGRYVEFNLIYDQGTLFGLQSGGRIESILVSMPPVVNWKYNWKPPAGSPEDDLVKNFLTPRDWASLTE